MKKLDFIQLLTRAMDLDPHRSRSAFNMQVRIWIQEGNFFKLKQKKARKLLFTSILFYLISKFAQISICVSL